MLRRFSLMPSWGSKESTSHGWIRCLPPKERSHQVVRWHEAGLFNEQTEAAAEALTCACFLCRTQPAEYFLERGIPLSGAKTGLGAFDWAANRGQVETVIPPGRSASGNRMLSRGLETGRF